MAGQTITGNSYTNENIKNIQAQLDKTTQQLKNYNTNAATDEELRKRAESEYTPTYNAQVGEQEAVKQSAQTALNNQLAALQRQYARDSETLGKNYDAQRVTANNAMLARGMNNSSLALAMLNRVEDQRNKALADLTAERSLAENQAHGAYNDAVKAADAAIGRLGSDLQVNIDARYQALKDQENQRVMQATQAQNQLNQYANELALQVEQLRQQGYSQYLQEQQAAAEQAERDRAYQQQQAAFELQKQQAAAEQAERDRAYQQQLAAFELQKQQYENSYAAQQKELEQAQQKIDISRQDMENDLSIRQQQVDLQRKELEAQLAELQKTGGSSGGSSGSSGGKGAAGTSAPQSNQSPGGSLEAMYNNQGNSSGGVLSSAFKSVKNAVGSGISGLAGALSNALKSSPSSGAGSSSATKKVTGSTAKDKKTFSAAQKK